MAGICSLSVFTLYALLVPTVNAQIGFRRRSRSVGRIVAGCVVGGVVLLFFLCLLCMMMRKRRARAQYARSHPGAPIPGNLNGWTPGAVGAPFSRFGSGGQRDPYPPQGGPQTSNYENQNPPVSTPHTSMTNNNPEYPPPSAPPPPPAYGKDANYGGNYNPPAGPPNTSQNAAPPIPPPTAYTGQAGNHKETNNFVGGFRA